MNNTIRQLEDMVEKMEVDNAYSFNTDFVTNYARLCEGLLEQRDLEDCQYYLNKLMEIKVMYRGILNGVGDGTVGWYDEDMER